MTTPWGDIPVCDAHVHFFSHNFFQSLLRQKGDLSIEAMEKALGWQIPPPVPETLAAQWVAEMDRFGVSRAALIASIPGDEDSVAAAVSRFPDRFYGFFMLDPLAPGALERARKAFSQAAQYGSRLQGICLFPAMHRYSIQDERVAPILELAASLSGVIVFVHCGVLTVGVRRKLGLPSLFDMRFSNPIDLHAVALRFPRVNFVVPHFGAGYFRETLMLCDLCPNVYLDTSSTNSWIRYQPESLHLKDVFDRALQVAGAQRLLFGTDSSFFPRGWHAQVFEIQAAVLKELGISEADAALIFGHNLQKLLSVSERVE